MKILSGRGNSQELSRKKANEQMLKKKKKTGGEEMHRNPTERSNCSENNEERKYIRSFSINFYKSIRKVSPL